MAVEGRWRRRERREVVEGVAPLLGRLLETCDEGVELLERRPPHLGGTNLSLPEEDASLRPLGGIQDPRKCLGIIPGGGADPSVTGSGEDDLLTGRTDPEVGSGRLQGLGEGLPDQGDPPHAGGEIGRWERRLGRDDPARDVGIRPDEARPETGGRGAGDEGQGEGGEGEGRRGGFHGVAFLLSRAELRNETGNHSEKKPFCQRGRNGAFMVKIAYIVLKDLYFG